ncbi:MAG: DUF4865 family protein [Pseudonocardiales bacterium]|nr:DUF4865 family protein [Pseudonocardiales bacterium]
MLTAWVGSCGAAAGSGGIIDSFGRPTIRHWTGVTFQPGPAQAATPRAVTRHTEAIPTEADPADAVARAVAELKQRAAAVGVGEQCTERPGQALSGTPPQQTAHGHSHQANNVRLTCCRSPGARLSGKASSVFFCRRGALTIGVLAPAIGPEVTDGAIV